MARFGKGHRVVHRIAVADFTHQDDVGRLAQGILQRRLPGIGVDTDFALRNDAALVLVNEFDRVLDRDDMTLTVLVAVIDQRRQRGGFPGSGTADKDHQTPLGHGDVLQHRRQTKLVERRDGQVDRPADNRHAPLLHQCIDAKTPDPRRRNGEIAFLGRFEFGRLTIVHDRPCQLCRMRRRQNLV